MRILFFASGIAKNYDNYFYNTKFYIREYTNEFYRFGAQPNPNTYSFK